MVALFSGENESEDWIENKPFDQAFSAGWHLFAQEQLVAVDEAKAHGVWRLVQAPPAIEKSTISHAELVRFYNRCANRAWEGDASDSESAVFRVCSTLEAFAQRSDPTLIPDSLRVEWHLKRVDVLLKQWAIVQDPSTGAEISAAFQLLSRLEWPHDEADQVEKAAFNAVYWWNQTLALTQQLLQQAFARSDWSEAMRLLELLMQMDHADDR